MITKELGKIFIAIVEIVLAVVQFLLLMRGALKIFNASDKAVFVKFIYDTTDSLLYPFKGTFDPIKIGNVVLEPHLLLGILIYGFIGYFLIVLIKVAFATDEPPPPRYT